MEFPSLLFTAGPSGHCLPSDLFEDIKLNLFFSDEAAQAMQALCPPSDIPVRQEFFRAFLEDPNVPARFAAMADVVETIWALADGMHAARCAEERDFTFLNLAAQLLKFSTMAAKEPLADSFLWRRFQEFFAALTASDRFAAVSSACSRTLELAAPLRESCWQVAGDSLVLRLEEAPTLTDSLLRCAKELGFTEVEAPADVAIRPATALIGAQAKLYPEAFEAIAEFARTYGSFYDSRILNYRSEMNFYLEAARLMRRLKRAGIPRTFPQLSTRRRLWIKNARDISLVTKNDVDIIPNDVDFTEDEPFWFLTGANGGGKTTYLRCVGINIVLFLSGCPVAGEEAEIWPVANVFTHFPRDERSDSEGRLSEEQARVDEILAAHGGEALVLLNETYSAANAEQAPRLTIDLAEQFAKSGSFGLFITHQHAMDDTDIPFLSVVIDEDEANRRTFKIQRQRGAARSFAEDILKRYHMDRDSLLQRFHSKEVQQ